MTKMSVHRVRMELTNVKYVHMPMVCRIFHSFVVFSLHEMQSHGHVNARNYFAHFQG